ncbi:MAG: zinc-dependent metalloprotease [Bacteroidota bacterium]
MLTTQQITYLFLKLLLLTLFCWPHLGQAQAPSSEFITPISINTEELTDLQREKLFKIESMENVSEFWLVRVAELVTAQQNGWLWLNLPDKDCTARIRALHVDATQNESGDYSWYGEVRPEEEPEEIEVDGELPIQPNEPMDFDMCYDGMVSLMRTDGIIVGQIRVDDDRYELHDLGAEIRVLIKRNYPVLERDCGVIGNTGNGYTGNADGRSTSTSCPIHILALFTPNADAAIPNIVNVINMDFVQANQALRNSRIASSLVEYQLIDIQAFNFAEGTLMASNGQTTGDIDRLISNQQLQTLKDDNDADIVVVFTDGQYADANGIAGEVLPTDPEDAVCIVEIDGALGRFTTAHEIGHILGCRHHLCDVVNGLYACDDDGTFEHAHTIRKGFMFINVYHHTIMLGGQSKRKFLNYSNPNVDYKNKPTGIADEHDNARAIRANACTVADFKIDNNPPTLAASISGNGFNCPCRVTGMTASIAGGLPPYTVEWRTSSDGFGWSGVQRMGNSFTVVLPCTLGDGVFVEMEVNSADNQSVTRVRFFEAATTWSGQNGPCPRDLVGEDVEATNTTIQVFPNPFDRNITIRHPSTEWEATALRLYDNTGKLIKEKIVAQGTSIQQSTLETEELPSGIYVIEVKSNGHNYTNKIVKM